MKNHTNSMASSSRGFAPIVLVAIVAVAVLTIGVGGYFALGLGGDKFGKSSGVKAGDDAVTSATTTATGVDAVTLDVPAFEMPSDSALPRLDVSAMNVTSASLPAFGVFKDFSANTDTSYSYKLDIPVPTVTLDVLTAPAIPMPAEPIVPAPTTPVVPGPTTGGTSAPTVNASTCAQFASMPSAQYCSSIPDPTGASLCASCKTAGF